MLVDREDLIPIETFWAGRETDFIIKSIRMLEQGTLIAQGRTLLMDDSRFQSGLGNVFDIPVERWLDADKDALEKCLSKDSEFRLQGCHPEDVIVEIKLHNTDELKELVGFEAPSIPIDEYDHKFFLATNTKMGAKVWARAAAVLASERVDPTAKKLAAYLLDQKDLWPKGKLGARNLEKNLAPFVQEFRRLTVFD